MSRASWKLPPLNKLFTSNYFWNKRVFKTSKRNLLLLTPIIGKKFKVYNGIWSITVTSKPDTVGLKLGELAVTKHLGRESHQKSKSKKRR